MKIFIKIKMSIFEYFQIKNQQEKEPNADGVQNNKTTLNNKRREEFYEEKRRYNSINIVS